MDFPDYIILCKSDMITEAITCFNPLKSNGTQLNEGLTGLNEYVVQVQPEFSGE